MYAHSISSIRPDKILVVKCKYDRSLKKITFSSARNCNFHLLQTRVEQCFALPASSYSIQYKDDDGEVVEITGENDLTEAIEYFHVPADDAYSARDSLSVHSFQSRSQREITLYFDVVAEYSGPSLSDASSIPESEVRSVRPSSELSLGLAELSHDPFGRGREPEFDERTFSFRDRSAAGSPASISRPLRPIPSALSSILAIQGSSNADSFPSESLCGGGIDDTQTHSADVDDPTAVFARMKLQESIQRNNHSDSDLLRLVPLWIEQQQRGLTPAAIMNSRLRRNRSFSALSSAPSGTSSDESASGKLGPRPDVRGKYYTLSTSSDPVASTQRVSAINRFDSPMDMLDLYDQIMVVTTRRTKLVGRLPSGEEFRFVLDSPRAVDRKVALESVESRLNRTESSRKRFSWLRNRLRRRS